MYALLFSSPIRRSICRGAGCCFLLPRSVRWESTRGLDHAGIAEFLSKPTWSVEALHSGQQAEEIKPSVTKTQLHHLLKLSALPLPKSETEEASMIKTLEAQLHFVKAVQSVDTSEIVPMDSIRDETSAGEHESTISIDSLHEHLAKESTVGFSRRIVRREDLVAQNNADYYDPLDQAPSTIGRYVVGSTNESTKEP